MSVKNTLDNLNIRDSSLVLRTEALRSSNISTTNLYIAGIVHTEIQSISQASGPSFTVDCGVNALPVVLVQTVFSLTPAGSYTGFHLLNHNIKATGFVKATIVKYGGTYGTQGIPYAFTYNLQDGDVEIGIANTGTTTFTNGSMTVLVEIFQKW